MRIDELKEPSSRCSAEDEASPEEILAAAQQEGIELSDERLERVSGGGLWDSDYYSKCPECGNTNIRRRGQQIAVPDYLCVDCGCEWG